FLPRAPPISTHAGTRDTRPDLESQPIALAAEPGHHTHRDVRQYGATPLRLTGENVREMDFHEGHPHGQERIAEREARVRERGGVDDRAVRPTLQPLDGVDQLALVVRLPPGKLHAKRPRPLAGARLD